MSKYIGIVCSLIFTTTIALAVPPSIEEGKTIFTNRCAACHNVNKELAGPALSGIDQRRPLNWIIKFIHSSQSVVKSGDTYAVNLYNKYNKITMPDHPDLTDDNIKSIVEYIKSESKQVTAEKPPFAKPGKLRPNYLPLSITNDSFFFISFLALIVAIVAIMIFAVHVKSIQRKLASENHGEGSL